MIKAKVEKCNINSIIWQNEIHINDIRKDKRQYTEENNSLSGMFIAITGEETKSEITEP